MKGVKQLVVVGAAALAAGAASLTLMSTGVAGAAPDMSGQTFSEAQAALSKSGYQAIMATTVGGPIPQADCLVTRSEATTASPFVGGDVTAPSGKPKVLLSLDCTKTVKNNNNSS